MNKLVLASLVAFLPVSSALASSIGAIAGSYKLVESKNENGGFCFSDITVKTGEDGTIDLYRNDVPEEPMYSAPLNGERSYKSSHGEAMTTSSNTDSVTAQNGVLIFKTISYVKVLGLPAGRESDAYALKLTDKDTLQAQRKMSAVGVAGVENKSASCVYKRN